MMLANPQKSAIIAGTVVPLAGLQPANDSIPLWMANLLKSATGMLGVPRDLANRTPPPGLASERGPTTMTVGGSHG